MVDSDTVFDPGFRVIDVNGNAVPGASIAFYDAGTTRPKTVYSDAGLTKPLGALVYCDAAGAPVAAEGGTTKVNIYVDDAAYKVIIKDGTGAVLETKDNIRGALNTEPFQRASIATPVRLVIRKADDTTIEPSDRGKVLNIDPTAATRTVTLPSAVTAGDGWLVTIRHIGQAHAVKVATVRRETISIPLAGGAAEAFELLSYGETVTLVSDGANWHCVANVIGLKLGSGYTAAVHDNGMISSGSLRPNPEEGNYQSYVNEGAHTLEPPSANCDLRLLCINGRSAGAIRTTNFNKVSGDPQTTANNDKFFLNISVLNGVSRLFVEALQ